MNKRTGKESHYLTQIYDEFKNVSESLSGKHGVIQVYLPEGYIHKQVRVVVWVEGRIKREVKNGKV